MCGIVGIVGKSPVNQALYDALLMLQHRGQDAAGIVTCQGDKLHLRKDTGLVRDVFRTRHMIQLQRQHGDRPCALSHRRRLDLFRRGPALLRQFPLRHRPGPQRQSDQCRGPEARPLRRGPAPHQYRVGLGGPAQRLRPRVAGPGQAAHRRRRPVPRRGRGASALPRGLCRRGHDPGLRHPRLPRPQRHPPPGLRRARDRGGRRVHDRLRERGPRHPGLHPDGRRGPGGGGLHRRGRAHLTPTSAPPSRCCRPASSSSSISPGRTPSSTTSRCTRRARAWASKLAAKIRREWPGHDIDVVIPIPDTSRTAALQLAESLGVPYSEGFIKNRYIGRTFIMPGQKVRKKSVRQKLNAIDLEFRKKNVLLVDDSIVRGTTSQQIIQMARDAGRQPGLFRLRRPAGALSQCLRHRHAVRHRTGRPRPHRGGGGAPAGRRSADLPGPRRPDRGGAEEGQELCGPLRHLGLQRRLCDRGRDHRSTCASWRPAATIRPRSPAISTSETALDLYNSA